MIFMGSLINGNLTVYSTAEHVLANNKQYIKNNTSNILITGPFVEKPPVTDGFCSQMASNVGSDSLSSCSRYWVSVATELTAGYSAMYEKCQILKKWWLKNNMQINVVDSLMSDSWDLGLFSQ